jgi:hypothetical protein
VKTRTYYRCTPDPQQHAHLPWYASHPAHVVVREDHIVTPLRRFFEQRIFGQSRSLLLTHSTDPASADGELAARTATLKAKIASLHQRQENLIRELEQFEPSGNDGFDQQWRSGIQTRFAAILAQLRTKQETPRRAQPPRTGPATR